MFRQPAAPPVMGLLVVGKQTMVPLKKVSVKAFLHGYLVGLKSTLHYSNETSEPLEVLFRFPVDESFAVVGLEAVIAGRKIKAVVKEKEEAKQMYDDAMASGFTAALGEEKTGDIFSISLGNLPPGSEAQLHLSLAGELPIDAEGGVRFTLPAVLKPRYTPTGSKDPLAHIGGGAPGQIQHGSTPAVFDFSLTVAEAGTVTKVTSPTHTVATETKSGVMQVTLENATPLEKDLVILVEFSNPHEPKAIPEPGDSSLSQQKYMGSPVVMLNFFPKIEAKRAACEFIFLVDRSGSMSGSYIKSARETLILFLKSIPPGCSFNIIGFGSSYRLLFPNSVPYDQTHLDEAMRHAETVQADLGGTELLSPLKHIFGQPLLSGLPRQVFVLTDGSVSNTRSCIDQVKRNARIARVFTFGIGSGASTELVKGLARAGNGTAEFVHEGERMQPKVISSLKRALQPAVTDLEVEFDVPSGFLALEAPTKLPTLFYGDKVVIYGIFRSKTSSEDPLRASLRGTATLKGQAVGKPLEYKISFEIPEPADSQSTFDLPIVHQLAAKSLIVDWQNKEGWSASVGEEERKKEIVDLSVEASVVSSHTAYIAVDEEQDQPIEGAVKTWDLTAGMVQQEEDLIGFSGFSGFRAAPLQRGYAARPMPQMAMGMPPPAPPGGLFGAPPPPSGGMIPMCDSFSASSSMMGGPPPPPPPTGAMFGGGAPQRLREVDNLAMNFSFGADSMESSEDEDLLMNLSSDVQLNTVSFAGPPKPPPQQQLFQQQQQQPKSRVMATRSSGSKPPSTGLTLLISLQQAEGFWLLDKLASDFLHKTLADLASKCPVKCENAIWATVIALVCLESRFASQQDEWELVAMKAEMWLDDQALPASTSLVALKEAAKKCI